MKHTLKIRVLLLLLTILFVLCAVTGRCAMRGEIDRSVVKSLDLNNYMGRWYEVARFDHSFERDMQNVTAEYKLLPNGSIQVLNSGYRDGVYRVAEGKAKTTNTPGLLRVAFFMNFYSDYRVLMIDKNYQYVLVGSSSPKYLWILSRTPQLEDATLQKIIDVAKQKGYDTDNLIFVKQ